MSAADKIVIEGAHAHNLQNLSLEIPRGKLVVITGLSGSGKSSLAFDTLYAEGRRRYLDTLSPYAKHFIGVLERPEVERITGLSPVIAIEQKTTGRNPRSTVGTITEVYDFLRLLYARAATAYSPTTGAEMVRYTDEQIVQLIQERYRGRKCLLLSPLVKGRKGHYKELFASVRKRGFTQVRIDGQLHELADIEAVDRYRTHFIELVVDKLRPGGEEDLSRLRASVVTALNFGKGSLAIADAEDGSLAFFSKNLICPETGESLPLPQPFTFSFNSPQGYCPHCKGLGMIGDVRMEVLIPDPSKSIADGAIVPLGPLGQNRRSELVRALARHYGFSLFDPVSDLPQEALSHLIYGSDELLRVGEGSESSMEIFPGVVDDVEEKIPCPVCGGTRLSPQARCFKIDGKDICEVAAMELSALSEWIDTLEERLGAREKAIARDILRELRERISFLLGVGLEYLSLDRPTGSLSGGESQRIRLATQIGSRLVNVLYILDEPSIGLHPRDNRKLLSSLRRLCTEGNSVVVVEHDAETMLAADHLVDIGPGAGSEGGRLCYNGPLPKDREGLLRLAGSHRSVTLDYLCGRAAIPVPARRHPGNGLFLTLEGARGNNLKDVTLRLPLGCLVGVSGVSGSGKSSLIDDTLVPVLRSRLHRAHAHALPYDKLTGLENIDKVIVIDQSPIGKTPRSNPATFTGVFDEIRSLFGQTPDAKARGFKPGRFSFNVAGGRCETCKGAGINVVEMNYLPPVHVVCPDCGGRRYKSDTLAVRYRGKSINDVLEMTIREAREFFSALPRIARPLDTMDEVGLGYVRLGQSAVTLSGGESQRMKLSAELARKDTGRTLYVLDEPTTGLHFKDVEILLDVLSKLTAQGNSVLVIEHNLDVLKSMDYLIDMGPDGGAAGGRIVSCGTPEQVAADPASATGAYLAEALGLR